MNGCGNWFGSIFFSIKSAARLDWIRFRIVFFNIFFFQIDKETNQIQSVDFRLIVCRNCRALRNPIYKYISEPISSAINSIRTRTCWHTSEKWNQQKKRTKAEPRNYDRRLRVLNAVRNIIHYFTFMGTCEHACMRFRTQWKFIFIFHQVRQQ